MAIVRSLSWISRCTGRFLAWYTSRIRDVLEIGGRWPDDDTRGARESGGRRSCGFLCGGELLRGCGLNRDGDESSNYGD